MCAIGGMADHVHLVLQIPQHISVADCVRHLKGFSSHVANRGRDRSREPFRWQEGYGVLTIGERSLDTVIRYVRNQKEHHNNRSILSAFERTDEGLPD